ncbi:MAG: hypothetical protein R2742_14730 [Micropruina glycogenica]
MVTTCRPRSVLGQPGGEAGQGGVQLGDQPLLGAAFVRMGVEPAERHRVDPGGYAQFDQAGHDGELLGQVGLAAGTAAGCGGLVLLVVDFGHSVVKRAGRLHQVGQ